MARNQTVEALSLTDVNDFVTGFIDVPIELDTIHLDSEATRKAALYTKCRQNCSGRRMDLCDQERITPQNTDCPCHRSS